MNEPVTDLLRSDSQIAVRVEPEIPVNIQTERLLLVLAGCFLAVNTAGLFLVRVSLGSAQWSDVLPLLVWVVCAFLGHRILANRLPDHDPLLFSVAMFLSGWGLLIIDRLAPVFADRQVIWLIVALGGMLITAALPHPLRWLRQYRYTLLTIGLLLLIATILLGRNPSGQEGAPQLWLGLGSLFFQPSEALKIILVAFLASYLAEQYPAMRAASADGEDFRRLTLSPRVIGPMILMWSLSIVVLVWQRDLGTAVLFFAAFIVLLYIASGYTLILVSGAVMTIAAAIAAYFLFNVVALRVDIWFNPWPEADGRAFQIVQSLMAFASGGVFGQGIGQGRPVYIPVVHSDFAFAALAEEWGLIGVIVVVGCIAVLISRGLRASIIQQDKPFHALLAVGLTTLLAVQSLLIMGGVLKLIPLTGVTLPFISYGGSSLLMSFVIVGFLLRLSCEN